MSGMTECRTESCKSESINDTDWSAFSFGLCAPCADVELGEYEAMGAALEADRKAEAERDARLEALQGEDDLWGSDDI